MNFTDFKNGDILLCRYSKYSTWYRWLFAHGIMLVDGTYYTHAQFYLNNELIEADIKLKTVSVDKNEGAEILVLRPKQGLTPIELQKANNLINQWLGKKYDYFGAIFSQLFYNLTFRKIWLGKTGHNTDRTFYCTEFVTSLMWHLRGYFPDHAKISPYILHQKASLYYEVVYEGIA